MKTLSQSAFAVVTIGFFVAVATLDAKQKPVETEIAGTVTAVDPAAKTITVKGVKGTMIIKVDIRKTRLMRDSKIDMSGGFHLAKVGDAVWGLVSLLGPEPVITHLSFTTNPLYGLPVPSRPGFVISPYAGRVGRLPLDVRDSPRGAMIRDRSSGKIFLVP